MIIANHPSVARKTSEAARSATVAPVPPPGTRTTRAARARMMRTFRAVASDIALKGTRPLDGRRESNLRLESALSPRRGPELPSVGVDDRLHDRQAEAEPGATGRPMPVQPPERLDHRPGLLGRDDRPRIHDLERGLAVPHSCPQPHPPIRHVV